VWLFVVGQLWAGKELKAKGLVGALRAGLGFDGGCALVVVHFGVFEQLDCVY